jgi:hypothetical protein
MVRKNNDLAFEEDLSKAIPLSRNILFVEKFGDEKRPRGCDQGLRFDESAESAGPLTFSSPFPF